MEEREEPILHCLIGIWDKEMDRRAERYQLATKRNNNHQFTLRGEALLKESIAWAGRNSVRRSSPTKGKVTQLNNQYDFEVDLDEKTCTCGRYQDTQVPCGHAVAFIYKIRKASNDYMPDYVKMSLYLHTYEKNLPVVSVADVITAQQQEEHRIGLRQQEDLTGSTVSTESDSSFESTSNLSDVPSDICKPPQTRIPRGRPANKRKKKGDMRRDMGKRARVAAALQEGIPFVPDRAPRRLGSLDTMQKTAEWCIPSGAGSDNW